MTLFSIPDAWTVAWSASLPVNGDLIVDPNVQPPGFVLRRHNWVLLNHFQTEQGRRAHLMTVTCDCGAEEQTMRPMVDDCPLRLFADGLTGLCAMSDERRSLSHYVTVYS
jgi:hypothetical protein